MDILKKEYQNKSVLVTGGAGFIGSHIVEKLVSLGALVTILDNFSTGSLQNLAAIKTNILIVEGDVRDSVLVKEVMQGGIEYVFHCAALVSVQQCLSSPEVSCAINYEGTKNIVDALSFAQRQKLIFSSTSAVYGNYEGRATEQTLLSPLSAYAYDKMRAEQYIQEAVIQKRLYAASILRYFNVYGDRQNAYGAYASVIPRFKDALMEGKPIIFFGDGHQTRDFVPVEEIVLANLITPLALQEEYTLCNVATGNSVSLHEIVQRLERESGKKATQYLYEHARLGEVRHSEASVEKWHAIKKKFYEYSESAMVYSIDIERCGQQKDV